MKKRIGVCGVLLLAGVVLAGGLGGCSVGSAITSGLGGGGNVRVTSRETGDYLTPKLRTRVYRKVDGNTVDFYLSDLDEATLISALEGREAFPAGSLMHVHMFLLPKAGNTPIDFTASNTTITQLVSTGEAVGVYGGGGFLLPTGKPGKGGFGGTMRDATVRFLGSSDGFADVLGPSVVSGKVSASRDDEVAGRLARLMPVYVARRVGGLGGS